MLKGKEKLNENTRIVGYQLSQEIYAEKQQNDFFIYLILFNLCDKAPRVVVNLSILLKRKLRVTGVKQLIFNKADIAYIFWLPRTILLPQTLLSQKRKHFLWVGLFQGQVYEEEVCELALDRIIGFG